jgi:hypothetical protein
MLQREENINMPIPNPKSPVREVVVSDNEIEELLEKFSTTPEANEIKAKFEANVLDENTYQQLMISGAMKLRKSE